MLNAHDLEEIRRKENGKANNEWKEICSNINRDLINDLRQERDELDTKIAKLENFINQGVYVNEVDREHKFMLVEQLKAMTAYYVILGARIRLMAAEYEVD